MNEKYKAYLLSAEWASIRVDLFLSRGRKCEQCGHKRQLQVHHKTYKNIFKEEPEDLIILCKNCHNAEHNIRSFKNKRVNKATVNRKKKSKRKNNGQNKILTTKQMKDMGYSVSSIKEYKQYYKSANR